MDNTHILFPNDYLIEGLEQLGIPYKPHQIDLCKKFFYQYSHHMKKISLSTIHSPKEFIEKHILDSLSAYPYLNLYQKISDLGSGGGFPGIILGIFLQQASITLIDVIEKKVLYLKNMVKFLELENICVYNASKEKVPGSFDLIVSRAVGSLSKVLLYAKPYLQKHTDILIYKGKKETLIQEEQELTKHMLSCLSIYPVHVPFLNAERHLALFRKPKI